MKRSHVAMVATLWCAVAGLTADTGAWWWLPPQFLTMYLFGSLKFEEDFKQLEKPKC